MDAKFSSSDGINLTGRILFLSLTGILAVSAFLLDLGAGRSFLSNANLTLPFLLSAFATWAAGLKVIPILRSLKAGQVIREDGPQAHLKKAGTPTMGGIFVVPVGVAIALLMTGFTPNVLAVSLLTLSYGFIGWLDDWQILRRRSNKGITPKQKLALQVGFGGLFCLWALFNNQSVDITNVLLPFGLMLPLGLLFWAIAWFTLVAESNASNLTDGLDGLAGGTGAIALLALGAVLAPNHPELMVFCASLSGSFLGFLGHNHNPARVFMGDTGSLALGGALAATAILTQSLFILLILSLIFLAETVSVIAQVGYYKATKDEKGIGKRLFKMAPLHHHLELSGWTETRVVGWFYGIAGILALLCLVVF
ncbi:phospho-N-acetylmuramoyl-pentapeptide-transferase [Leptolyngbya sp. AN02str]|uniref:phospho-N-acetylmuramoyl-pentapeptide- transferase n=1 Tax=Leptolyngbya sp. AN02str TaxID=3423363 RepID=UPI003D311584